MSFASSCNRVIDLLTLQLAGVSRIRTLLLLTVPLSLNESMLHSRLTKTGFLLLTLGTIATSSVLNACSTSPQTQAQAPSPTATDTGAMQGMDPLIQGVT